MKLSKERKQEIAASRENVYLKALTNFFPEGEHPITEVDVSGIFRLYDEEFFNGQVAKRVIELSKTGGNGYSIFPNIHFYATRRTSGYGSISGYYFEKIFNRETEEYDFEKVFFIDICPNLLDTIFDSTKGKGLPFAAGIGCEERIKCFMLVLEHEIIHLLMSLWDFDSQERQEENFNIFGPHGRLFNCMLETYFGHTQHSHNLALKGVYVPPFKLEPGTPKETGAGFSNWSASCYLDSVIMVMLETQSNFWRSKIFDWTSEKDKLARFQSKNADLTEQVKEVILKDYKVAHEEGAEALQCVDLRELLSIQDPLMKTVKGGWKMYESGSTYATFVQLFPELLIDIPVKIVRTEIGEEESMTYRSDGAFTYSDFMLSTNTDQDYKKILWEECQSPVLVFTHQAAPRITIFDSLKKEKGLKYNKVRTFGPRIINDRYKLAGVVVLHGHIDAKGGGGHYTSYFLAKDGLWYHYNDMGPTFKRIGNVEDLPRDGVWQQSSSRLPTMYFYVLDEPKAVVRGLTPKKKTPKKVTPLVFQTERKEKFLGDDIDYVRVDRPDHGVIFIAVFKNPGRKNAMLKVIREFTEGKSSITETKMEEDKIAWRVPNAQTGNDLHEILKSFSERKQTPPKEIKIYEHSGKPLRNKAFAVYDYSDKTVAVTGSGVSSYAKELGNLGLETQSLKYNLGKGFVISKTKIVKLKKLLEL